MTHPVNDGPHSSSVVSIPYSGWRRTFHMGKTLECHVRYPLSKSRALQPDTFVRLQTLLHINPADMSKFLHLPDLLFLISKVGPIVNTLLDRG